MLFLTLSQQGVVSTVFLVPSHCCRCCRLVSRNSLAFVCRNVTPSFSQNCDIPTDVGDKDGGKQFTIFPILQTIFHQATFFEDKTSSSFSFSFFVFVMILFSLFLLTLLLPYSFHYFFSLPYVSFSLDFISLVCPQPSTLYALDNNGQHESTQWLL